MTDPRVAEVLAANGLTADSRLYRYSLPDFLTPIDEADRLRLSANEDPSEAVRNVYGQGHVELAAHLGPGLAFAESPENLWKDSERVCVELRLGDAMAQGGRVYPVESITTERVWYVTLPEGAVSVRIIEARG